MTTTYAEWCKRARGFGGPRARNVHWGQWKELVRYRPRLGLLLDEAMAVRATDPHFCANALWYGYANKGCGLREEMAREVGWSRQKPSFETERARSILCSPNSYDLAYDVLYQALPSCRDCGCYRLSG